MSAEELSVFLVQPRESKGKPVLLMKCLHLRQGTAGAGIFVDAYIGLLDYEATAALTMDTVCHRKTLVPVYKSTHGVMTLNIAISSCATTNSVTYCAVKGLLRLISFPAGPLW
jgi:hypothetical protein